MISKSSIATGWLSATLMILGGAAHSTQTCVMLDSAPASHTVQSGDTLWDIASRFLQDPWCWRAVWSDNRERIANPHWIYPGQQVILDRARGELRVLPADAQSEQIVRRSPGVRASATPSHSAIPLVDPKLLALTMTYRLVPAAALTKAPRITATGNGRRLWVAGDTVRTTATAPAGEVFDVLRALAPLREHEHSVPLAIPMKRLGQVRRQAESPQEFLVFQTDTELSEGDVLMPVSVRRESELLLHELPKLESRVLAVMREGRYAAQYDIVALNQGLRDGVSPGSIVEIRATQLSGPDNTALTLSPGATATLWIFDALDRSALALIIRSRAILSVGSLIKTYRRND